MNKKDPIGVLRHYKEFQCDYYFNAISELSFEIPQRIYDSDKCEWIDNPHYDDIQTDMLLYLADPTEQYKFSGSPILADNQYSLKSLSETTARPSTNMKYNVNGGLNGFEVQEEVLLFDLGLSKGYLWNWQHYFDSSNGYASQKAVSDTESDSRLGLGNYEGYKH